MGFSLNYCAKCNVFLGPDDFDGICSECDEEEEEATANGEVHLDYTIHCHNCGKLLRTADGEDIFDDIYDDQDGEDICKECYEAHVEPFELWDEGGNEVIGYKELT